MVYNEENSENSEYWTEIVSRKMRGDLKIDNVADGPEGTEHDKNVPQDYLSDEFLESEGDLGEKSTLKMKYIDNIEKKENIVFSSSKLCDYTEEFKGNNFENENDFVLHFEEAYENEYFKSLENLELPYDFVPAKQISKTIGLWLQEMEKKLDYIYNYEMPSEDLFDIMSEPFENCIFDPFISTETIDEDSIEEIISLTSNKKLTKVQGKCQLRLKDGTELIGSWQNGRRNGQGSISSPSLDQLGVRMLAGKYNNGVLSGIGKIHMIDGSIREGWFCQGKADGPFRGDVKGSGLVWLGHYAEGVPVGICWQAVLGKAWLVGQLDTFGQMTGSDVAFLYPDLKTALVGEFRNGELVSAFHAIVTDIHEELGLLIPSFEKLSKTEFRQWPSSRQDITCPHHLRDPYEDQLVEVCTSEVSGGGDGLRTKANIPAGTLVAYYHGLRMNACDENIFEKSTGYAIYLEWEIELRKTSDILDIAPQYQSTENYTSTLAHKINHSFKPNCEWIHALHPCYGKIPAITTLEDLKDGDELFIHYGFDMDEAPQWYLDFWMMTE